MRKVRHTETSKKPYYIAIIIFLILFGIISFVKSITHSLFFEHTDRLNFVIYGKQTMYYSVGLTDAGNYAMSFPADVRVQVPGGYGYYRIGALGKLISWDKKPDILKRTFSLTTHTMDSLYFYPSSVDLYYGTDTQQVAAIPKASQLFFLSSNASFFDRLYIWLHVSGKKQSEFTMLTVPTITDTDGDLNFDTDTYQKKYTGYLFQETYRNERKTVQILYTNDYVNGDRVASILEGNGIRVTDISEGDSTKGCEVVESSSVMSQTAQSLVTFFHCGYRQGKTDIYDILLQLGNKEGEWEIKE